MSREIKFRAKVLNSKNWIYRQPFHIRGTWYMYNSLWDKVPINYKTLGQYTGLKDKNGKEIYEVDIVNGIAFDGFSLSNGVIKFPDCSYTVEFKGKNARGFYYLHHIRLETIEVIGNIYDNPELLEQSS